MIHVLHFSTWQTRTASDGQAVWSQNYLTTFTFISRDEKKSSAVPYPYLLSLWLHVPRGRTAGSICSAYHKYAPQMRALKQLPSYPTEQQTGLAFLYNAYVDLSLNQHPTAPVQTLPDFITKEILESHVFHAPNSKSPLCTIHSIKLLSCHIVLTVLRATAPTVFFNTSFCGPVFILSFPSALPPSQSSEISNLFLFNSISAVFTDTWN